jgi:hypothetical protein
MFFLFGNNISETEDGIPISEDIWGGVPLLTYKSGRPRETVIKIAWFPTHLRIHTVTARLTRTVVAQLTISLQVYFGSYEDGDAAEYGSSSR